MQTLESTWLASGLCGSRVGFHHPCQAVLFWPWASWPCSITIHFEEDQRSAACRYSSSYRPNRPQPAQKSTAMVGANPKDGEL